MKLFSQALPELVCYKPRNKLKMITLQGFQCFWGIVSILIPGEPLVI